MAKNSVNLNEIIEIIADGVVFASMAILGSIAKSLARHDGKMTRKFIFSCVSNAVIAGFCGLLMAPLNQILGLGLYWSLFIAGMAGWTGAEFLDILVKMAIRRVAGGNRNDTL